MKSLIVFCLSVGVLAAAEGPVKKRVSTTKTRPASSSQIPAGATQSSDGTFRYTDTHGTQWNYRKTPFGVSRWQEQPVDKAAEAAADAKRYEAVKAIEEGDTIHFERRGPFGVSRWDRKKSDLDAMESAVWNRDHNTAVKQD